MNIFKIFIPKENLQEVSELESWTVSWEIATSVKWGDPVIKYKCFVNEDEAVEFKKQLEKSAKFIGTPIYTKMYQN